MPSAHKSQLIGALLLLLILALFTDVRAADAPLRKSLGPPSEQSEVRPRRVPRALSRQEIFQAIQDNLAQRGISGNGGLRPGDLKIQASVPVLKDDTGLQVKRIGFDPLRRETVFELWTSQEPQYLPFEVTTHRDPQSLGLTLRGAGKLEEENVRTESQTSGRGVSRARAKLPVLAKPGTPATLVMLGQNMRITTTVDPLQPGIRGQCILVRDPATARVMTAEVVDEGLLQISF
jgi:hypothetical protein